MNIDDIKISIITPTFNSGSTIVETYNSISKQTHENWEWLVTDDCSSDDTINILSSICEKDSRVRVFKNSTNSGAAVTRNNSLSNVSGDFITFIDSDDLWFSSKLEKQLNFMIVNELDFTFTAYELVDAQGIPLGKVVDLQGDNFSVNYSDMLKKKATLGCSTVMIKKNAFSDFSMPLIRTGQDYALWLKLLKSGKKAHLLNEILTRYRILPNSISRNKFKKSQRQWNIYREIENLSVLQSAYCFCFYAWRAIFRK
ncbi:TPA: glycosyltransferase family 2 protein [Enterobacter hormaechei subsp. steigerwaltii]|jgi:teichuronic acid biosynthesis glycosyltransferase TuaG|nr:MULTISPECIES: glycosyltransferase family 2 protein [Enterobacter]ELT3966396.1 glycosyltransferase family 2 protein [Enterobacter hormaechei subsp. steigerwaltii]ELC6547371.1 glycosyltransferase family 2 protein [Enterobacter hormaechei]ELC6557880.1 glycosyltransferase family 2 protein [Enterobacter hormaechei]ELX8342855.1 glycosyltransferase family 2 protein [Enterobacter hormaechei]ELZ2866249.1 glycosyltransferase family 2 protein [Enterobacter hormaechei]